jgi:hypothetical protein
MNLSLKTSKVWSCRYAGEIEPLITLMGTDDNEIVAEWVGLG